MFIHELLESLEKASQDKSFPQNAFPEALDADMWNEIKCHPRHAAFRDKLVAVGNEFLSKPIELTTFGLYKLFDTTSNRLIYEDAYFHLRSRLNTFALLSKVFDDEVYVAALEDCIWQICSEYTWSLPAHLRGRSLNTLGEPPFLDERGLYEGQPYPNEKNLDLFACETAQALCEICYLLEDTLSPKVVHRARSEVFTRVLYPYSDAFHLQPWDTYLDNWLAVCAGSIGMCAIYLIKNNDSLASILHKALSSIECYISTFGEDGCCCEGIGYWTYGFGYFVCFADMIKKRTGGRINLFESSKVESIAMFQQKCYLTGEKTIPFSDAMPSNHFRKGIAAYLARIYDNFTCLDEQFALAFNEEHRYRWSLELRDTVWGHAYVSRNIGCDDICHFENAQWLIAKYKAKGNNYALAIKGGHNDEPHNHNDVGTFALFLGEQALLADVGCGEYTKEYFSEKRYEIFCNNSFSHNLPIISGQGQTDGALCRANNWHVMQDGSIVSASMDIASAYNIKGLAALRRSYTLDTSSGVITLTDVFNTDETLPITERFVSLLEIESEQNSLLFGKGGQRVRLDYNANILDVAFSTKEHIDHFGQPQTVYLADLLVKDPTKTTTIVFAFLPI